MRIFISSLVLVLLSLSLHAQRTSRSGFPAKPENKDHFRRFPCGGNVILDEKFTGGLPTGWQVLDVDQLDPRDEILGLTPNPGWQGTFDFKDNLRLNKILASPSWYQDTVASSNDYLILPQMVLPNNTCLSWYAYSQDAEFGESYEVRVSTTTADEAGFLANPPVYIVDNQGSEFTYESADLSAYGGQNVYVAFRHTSSDKFILALDDVLMAEVEQFDISMFKLDPITADPGDSIYISGSVINLGLVPFVFDSLQMEVHFAVNNVELFNFGIADSFEFLPNDTIQFSATQAWVPLTEASIPLAVWVVGFGTDDQVVNDTISRFQPIGNTVPVDPELSQGSLSIYPNPVHETLVLNLEEFQPGNLKMNILSLQGQTIQTKILHNNSGLATWSINTQNLSNGVYILLLEDAEGKRFREKFIKK